MRFPVVLIALVALLALSAMAEDAPRRARKPRKPRKPKRSRKPKANVKPSTVRRGSTTIETSNAAALQPNAGPQDMRVMEAVTAGKKKARGASKKFANVMISNSPLDGMKPATLQVVVRRRFCRKDSQCKRGERCQGYDPNSHTSSSRKSYGICAKKSIENQPCSKKKKCPKDYYCAVNSHSVDETIGVCNKRPNFAKLFKDVGEKVTEYINSVGDLFRFEGKELKPRTFLQLRDRVGRRRARRRRAPTPAPTPLPTEFTAPAGGGAVPTCGSSSCDIPSVRDSYTNFSNIATYYATYHIVRSKRGAKYNIANKKLKYSTKSLTKVYTKVAGLAFKTKVKKYTSFSLRHSVVGSRSECNTADASLDDTYTLTLRKSQTLRYVGSQRVQRPKKWVLKTTKYMFLTGDRVTLDMSLDATAAATDTVETCVFRCKVQSTNCGRRHRRNLRCWNVTKASPLVGQQYTFTNHGAHGVSVRNLNKVSNVAMAFGAVYSRLASCIDGPTYAATLDSNYTNSFKPFNVMVVDFAARLDNGLAQKTLQGYGNFPWDTANEHGNLYMSYQWLGKGSQKVLDHEIGHCVGLWHTFHGTNEVPAANCPTCAERPQDAGKVANDVRGDMASDTWPAFKHWDCSKKAGFYICGNNTGTALPMRFNTSVDQPFRNIMSYSSCRKSLTPQQVGRLRCFIAATTKLRNAILSTKLTSKAKSAKRKADKLKKKLEAKKKKDELKKKRAADKKKKEEERKKKAADKKKKRDALKKKKAAERAKKKKKKKAKGRRKPKFFFF